MKQLKTIVKIKVTANRMEKCNNHKDWAKTPEALFHVYRASFEALTLLFKHPVKCLIYLIPPVPAKS